MASYLWNKFDKYVRQKKTVFLKWMKIPKCDCMKFLDKILIEGKYNNLPADHFMCEENTLHLGVSDMVTTLILNDLEENETKMIKKSHSSELNSDSCTWVGIASN